MLDRDHDPCDTQICSVPVDLGGRQVLGDTQRPPASVDLDRGQVADGTQSAPAPVDLDGRHGESDVSNGGGQRRLETQRPSAPAEDFAADGRDSGGQTDTRGLASATLADALLLVYADAVEDLQKTRVATTLRLKALGRDKGLEESPEASRLEALIATLNAAERHATRELERAMKAHPLGAWVEGTQGVGLKSAGRLLAAIGDPAARSNPAKLWAYCGFHVVGGKRPRRTKGQQSNWNTKAKTHAYLCAESCMKNRRSPYRAVYEHEREKWADRDTTDLHKHNHALSVTAKAILLDLWREATRLARGQAEFAAHNHAAARDLEGAAA